MATDLSKMNVQQKEAIMESIKSNVVLLASAGSGKTTVLIKRTEYLIDDCGVKPENIMLITFTNKAADEIKERMSYVSSDADKMWIGTFHSICVRILRKFGCLMGIDRFSIMDDKAKNMLIRKLHPDKNLDRKEVRKILNKISAYKSSLINPAKVLNDLCPSGKEDYAFAALYQDYQNVTWSKKTFDFDDLIIYTILLLNSPQFCESSMWIHENIKYIMIDEMQDTSTDQYTLVRLLTGNNNIMCVGDYSQSIYGFRNAKPEYLNNFANIFPNTKMMKLEINYRSTKCIVRAANAVINHNSSGEKIDMKSVNEPGSKISFKHIGINYNNPERAEAEWICSEIRNLVAMGLNSYGDFAVINRTNVQNKTIELVLRDEGIPYSVVGSSSFWNSVEMKDMLAYCKTFINPKDTDSVKRILESMEGIGQGTAGKILAAMDSTGSDVITILKSVTGGSLKLDRKSLTAKALSGLTYILKALNSGFECCSYIVSYVIKNTPYGHISTMNPGYQDKMDKFEAVIKAFQEYEKECLTIEEVVDKVSLMSDTKGSEKENLDSVKIMTGHACKGLEFDTVFIAGAEEGLFPHFNSLNCENAGSAVEEERRLFYVAMTRAKRKLYITACGERNGSGRSVSRFVSEIPESYTEIVY